MTLGKRRLLHFSVLSLICFSPGYVTAQTGPLPIKDFFAYYMSVAKDRSHDDSSSNFSIRSGAIELMAQGYLEDYKGQDCSFMNDELVLLLKEDPSPSVRAAVASVLPLFSRDRARGPLLEALQDQSPLVRLYAAESLVRRMADTNSMAALSVLAKIATSEALAGMGKAEFLKSGESPGGFLLLNGKSPADCIASVKSSWRARAVKSLRKSSTQYARTIIASLRMDKDPSVRFEATQ